MERKERYFHECPECGLLTPWLQRKCDCGYHFKQSAPASRRSAVTIFALSILLALAVGYILAGGGSVRSAPVVAVTAPAATAKPTAAPTPAPTAKPKATAAPAPTLQPVLILNGAVVKDTDLEKLAPFSVEASGSSNYYVYLKCLNYLSGSSTLPSLSGYGDLSFYVSSGKTAEVLVPLGSYEVYYATGDTWYGSDHKFGSSTRYYKCDNKFIFTQSLSGYDGWTVTLYPVPNGNMETDKISAAAFPD